MDLFSLPPRDQDVRFLRSAPRSLRSKILKIARENLRDAKLKGAVAEWKDDFVVFLETLHQLDHQRALSRVQSAASEYLVAVQLAHSAAETRNIAQDIPPLADGSKDLYTSFTRAWVAGVADLPSSHGYWHVTYVDEKRRALIGAMADLHELLFGDRPDDTTAASNHTDPPPFDPPSHANHPSSPAAGVHCNAVTPSLADRPPFIPLPTSPPSRSPT